MASAAYFVADSSSHVERVVRAKAQSLASFASNLTMFKGFTKTATDLLALLPQLGDEGKDLAELYRVRYRKLMNCYERFGRPQDASTAAGRQVLELVRDFGDEFERVVLNQYPFERNPRLVGDRR